MAHKKSYMPVLIMKKIFVNATAKEIKDKDSDYFKTEFKILVGEFFMLRHLEIFYHVIVLKVVNVLSCRPMYIAIIL